MLKFFSYNPSLKKRKKLKKIVDTASERCYHIFNLIVKPLKKRK